MGARGVQTGGRDYDWTPDREAMLKALWAEGLSASQIQAELGGTVTRNAVIGKVHRMGLSGRGGNGSVTAAAPHRTRISTKSTMPRRPRVDRIHDSGFRASGPEALPPADAVPDRAEDLEIPAEQRRTLLQLTEHTCRWPVGEPTAPDFFFCGSTSGTDNTAGLPYCSYHGRVASAGLPTRRSIRPRYRA